MLSHVIMSGGNAAGSSFEIDWMTALGALISVSIILGVCAVLYFTISSPGHHE